MIKVICFGDVVGLKGCRVVAGHIQNLKEKYKPDLIIVNGENSGPQGRGPSCESLQLLMQSGAHIITGGNHSFGRREVYDFYSTSKTVLRPCNFPPESPGLGSTIINVGNDISVGIINVQLRVFMRDLLSCPFRAVESILGYMKSRTSTVIIDMHGEATSEKVSFGYHFDGKVSLIFGTHTHVQTSDERILPKGTAYISDVGMTGALHSSLGARVSSTIQNFITQLPVRFESEEEGPFVTGAVYVEIDEITGKAKTIKRLALFEGLEK